MTINLKNIGVLIFLLFFGFSVNCQSITKVSYFAGSMWGFSKVTITKDSIVGELVRSQKKIIIKETTQKKFWNMLVQSMTIDDFKKVKNRKPEPDTDGNVTSISLESKDQDYSIRDAEIDPIINKNVFTFVQIIKERLDKIYLREKDK
jgi:hypothetical protein